MLSVLKNDARKFAVAVTVTAASSAAVAAAVTATYKGSCRLDGAVAMVGYCNYSFSYSS
jgi:hypothetical protein